MNLANKVFLTIAVLVGSAYIGANVWLLRQKNELIYPPLQENAIYFFAEKLPSYQLRYDKVELTSDYGNVESCVFPSFSKENTWIIYLHHTDNLYYSDSNLWRYKIWNNLGINTITLNYINEENGKHTANPEKMYQSALVAYNYLVDILEVPEDKILVYGEGFGAYPASKLAQEMPVSGLILENAIRSQNYFLRDLYPVLLSTYLIKEELDIQPYLSKINKSLLFVHIQGKAYPSYYDIELHEKSKNEEKKILYLASENGKLPKKALRSYQKSIADLLKQLKLRKI